MARTPRNRQSLNRRGPRREPYDRVLIVCEGEKTEPNYLIELISQWKLSSANVKITGDGGSAPESVIEYAIQRFEASPDYDRVYCVIDRDSHPNFSEAVERVKQKTLTLREGRKKLGKAHFEAIVSIPCFEYWILLHYRYSTAPMARFADVRPWLHQIPELADYDKGRKRLFALTEPKLQTALTNAERANREAAEANTDNPTTQMPNLIRYLRELADRKNG